MLADIATIQRLKEESRNWPSIDLDGKQTAELELWLIGALDPLSGYLDESEVQSVQSKRVLGNKTPCGTAWQLEVHERYAANLSPGDKVALRDAEGVMLALLTISENSPALPGQTRYLAGELTGMERPVHFAFTTLRQIPNAVREQIASQGWKAVVAVSPDILLTAAEAAFLDAWAEDNDGGILLFCALEGQDELDFASVHAVEMVAARLGKRALLVLLGTDPVLPLMSLVAHNYGATSLFLRQEVALAQKRVFKANQITPLVLPDDIMDMGTNGLFPEAEIALRLANPPPDRRGVVVFFTGLSGSGKSTLARALQARMMEIGPRRVTLLDGDLVRKHLSSELTFSREHRDLNIKRIGYVAAEVGKHGGVAICCPIAPYDQTRKEVRAMVEQYAGFILVHVNTPLLVCEKRDRKGLYAKARAGLIKEFTGISDPYEIPMDAEVVINTAELSIQEGLDVILKLLRDYGYIG